MGRGMLAVMARNRADVMIERTPQTPFMMVIISASRKFLQVSSKQLNAFNDDHGDNRYIVQRDSWMRTACYHVPIFTGRMDSPDKGEMTIIVLVLL